MLFLQTALLLTLLPSGNNENGKNSVQKDMYVCTCVRVCVCMHAGRHIHLFELVCVNVWYVCVYGVVSSTERLRISA